MGNSMAPPSVFQALRGAPPSIDFWLPRCCALLATAIGPLPLVLDLRWNVSMASTGPVLWALSVALVVAAGLLAHRNNDRGLLRTLFVALLGGTLATNTYDTFRFSGFSGGVIAMDEAGDFGGRLTGQIAPGPMHHGSGSDHMGKSTHVGSGPGPSEAAHDTATQHAGAGMHAQSEPGGSQAMQGSGGEHATDSMDHEGKSAGQPNSVKTILIGYAWHIWAGVMFSLAFLILFSARHWWMPIPYMVLFIYPGMVFAMGADTTASFVWEAAGHAAFGATLGAVGWAYLSRAS
ncbi:MAG: hypothetical protein HYR63_03820 [Proteobacteria bacterium]|nr:hypothetical protein [Pseudomonadota bacterium]MBI3498587.1 hypothetical protein [Pseudomonadota bacterium]